MAAKGELKATWENQMVKLIKANTSYEVVTQYRFHIPEEGEKRRRWMFDAAILDIKVGFELDGGIWSGGRHIRPAGFEADLEKINTATLQGWKVYRFTPRMLNQGWIEKILEKYRNA